MDMRYMANLLPNALYKLGFTMPVAFDRSSTEVAEKPLVQNSSKIAVCANSILNSLGRPGVLLLLFFILRNLGIAHSRLRPFSKYFLSFRNLLMINQKAHIYLRKIFYLASIFCTKTDNFGNFQCQSENYFHIHVISAHFSTKIAQNETLSSSNT